MNIMRLLGHVAWIRSRLPAVTGAKGHGRIQPRDQRQLTSQRLHIEAELKFLTSREQ